MAADQGTRRPLAVALDFTVKTYDIDFAGIVSNIVYVRWLEDLRLQFLAAHMPLAELMAGGLAPVLVRTEIAYHRPVRLFDRPVGHLWAARLGRLRWELQAEFRVNGDLAAEARQKGCFVYADSLKLAPIPEPMTARWQAALSRP